MLRKSIMKVRELLNSPSKWVKRVAAIKNGHSALATDDCDAYCIYGAIAHCYGFRNSPAPYAKVRSVVGMSPVAWNDLDSTTFADIKRVLSVCDI